MKPKSPLSLYQIRAIEIYLTRFSFEELFKLNAEFKFFTSLFESHTSFSSFIKLPLSDALKSVSNQRLLGVFRQFFSPKLIRLLEFLLSNYSWAEIKKFLPSLDAVFFRLVPLVQLELPSPVSSDQALQIASLLRSKIGNFSFEVQIIPEILRGLILRKGFLVLDASVDSLLRQIR